MPCKTHRFDTPKPITLLLRNPGGSVRLLASDREDTVVEVTGAHDGNGAIVTCSDDGRSVTVLAPPHSSVGSGLSLKVLGRSFGRSTELDIVVRLPTGSHIDLTTASAEINVSGEIGRLRTRSASGMVTVDRVLGDTEVSTASGEVRLGPVEGSTTVKSASGDVTIESSKGALFAATASGEVTIGRAESDVTAKSASGDLSVRQVSHGEVAMTTSSGSVSIGVLAGTLVWLDLVTVSGRTTSGLTPDDPDASEGEGAVRIRVRTVSGDITIARSATVTAA